MRRVLFALVVATGITMSAGSANAELIVNGGFETGNLAGWTNTGNTGFTGVTGAPYNRSGNFGAFLGPVGSQGQLSQTFASVPGAIGYEVDFSNVNFSGSGVHNFSALFNGNTIYTAPAPAFPYTDLSFTVAAGAGPTQTLLFDYRHDPSFFGLDDVSVNQIVPEPMSMAIFGGLAVAGLAGLRRRMTKV